MEITLQIDTRNKDGKNLIEYLKNLSYVKFSKTSTKTKKKTEFEKKIEESIKQVEEGKIIRFKSAADARKYCDAL